MTTRTPAANAKTLSLSLRLWVGAVAIELSKKIEGARDDDGPGRPRQPERPSAGLEGVGKRLDMLEIRFGAGCEVPCPERPGIRGLRGDERRPEDREGLEHELGPLVLEDRADEDVLPAREPRQEVADAGEVVRAVPDLERLLAPELEPAGERDVLGGVRVDLGAEERLGGGGREG